MEAKGITLAQLIPHHFTLVLEEFNPSIEVKGKLAWSILLLQSSANNINSCGINNQLS